MPAGAAAERSGWPQTVGEWTVAIGKDGDGCFLSRRYDRLGATTLLLGLDRDGTNHLSVLNANWTIQPRDRQALDFRLSKGRYDRHFVVGIAADGQQGFATSFEWRFPAYFATSAFLHIDRGRIPVERLSLEGSGDAVATLRRCVAALGRTGADATKAAGAGTGIPRDPFAESVSKPRRARR
ncbi:hypothetical protein GCM10011380_26950 [Sphingomonas metalli]|uniref:Uncharacterized protein n=2 Tax=Sphingomonas metalli TaxID=1779358 RepID=A0A916T8Z9_9SPHN|nr:hypothetical protein GCM10011380_26950 [Sphingomonas metalli]